LRCATLGGMADRGAFVVLRYVITTPSAAACKTCQCKFFTPNSYYGDPFGAEQYLHTKFDLHDCLMEKSGQGRKVVWNKRW
jgi:hypothetical protein